MIEIQKPRCEKEFDQQFCACQKYFKGHYLKRNSVTWPLARALGHTRKRARCVKLSRTAQTVFNHKGTMEQQHQESAIPLAMESLNVEESPREVDNFGRHSSAGQSDQASDVEELRCVREELGQEVT